MPPPAQPLLLAARARVPPRARSSSRRSRCRRRRSRPRRRRRPRGRGIDLQPPEGGGDAGNDLDLHGSIARDHRTGTFGGLDHRADGPLTDAGGQSVARHAVRHPRTGLPRRPLHDVDLRPALRLVALACSVHDGRMVRVELRELDELHGTHPRGSSRHVAAVELVHPSRCSGAGLEAEAKPVAGAPRGRSKQERIGLRRDVLPHETPLRLEAAGREDDRRAHRQLPKRLAKAEIADTGGERANERRDGEANAPRLGVSGRVLEDAGAEALEPDDVPVEGLVNDALECGVSTRALLAEPLQIAVAPHHSAREAHRAPHGLRLLQEQDVCASLGRLDCRNETSHPGSCYHHVGHVRRARSPACARRTRASRGQAPRRTRRACSPRRPPGRRRGPGRAPPPRPRRHRRRAAPDG